MSTETNITETEDYKRFWLPEFYDVIEVFKFGDTKHPRLNPEKNNYLEPNGSRCSFKQMHDSMFHHLAESYVQNLFDYTKEAAEFGRGDYETDLDPLLHLIARAMIAYVRIKRGIIHEDDRK